MRNLTLHGLLTQFTTDAGTRLNLAASTDEIPFEVVDSGNNVPLYCYRPLTADFIHDRLGLLTALSSYAAVVRTLEGVGQSDAYLRARGLGPVAGGRRAEADAVLEAFLSRVFDDRSEFGFDAGRFEVAYVELERAIYEGRCVSEVVVALFGLDFDPDTEELALGEGLSIVRPEALAATPDGLVDTEAQLLLVLRIAHDRRERPSAQFVRARFRRVLTALRLYERGSYALGQVGYSRIDDGGWAAIPIGAGGRLGDSGVIPGSREDEFRAFCSLIARRLPRPGGELSGAGELTWALARFEMACERPVAFEALSDYLLALRALLEPEGPSSGRLAQRLAVICAAPVDRGRMAERTAHAIALERSVIAGLAPLTTEAETLIAELGEHLRAILRDVLCGHLDTDVRALADDLVAQEVEDDAVDLAADELIGLGSSV